MAGVTSRQFFPVRQETVTAPSSNTHIKKYVEILPRHYNSCLKYGGSAGMRMTRTDEPAYKIGRFRQKDAEGVVAVSCGLQREFPGKERV